MYSESFNLREYNDMHILCIDMAANKVVYALNDGLIKLFNLQENMQNRDHSNEA